MSDTETITDTDIPAQRLGPEHHLKRAAKTQVASDAERYHLQAALAEAATRILAELKAATTELHQLYLATSGLRDDIRNIVAARGDHREAG